MEEKTVSIPAISCGHCVSSIQREVIEFDGVIAVEGDPATREMAFRWVPPATWEGILKLLSEMGYPPEGE